MKCLKNQPSYKDGSLTTALQATFLELDLKVKAEESASELQTLAGTGMFTSPFIFELGEKWCLMTSLTAEDPGEAGDLAPEEEAKALREEADMDLAVSQDVVQGHSTGCFNTG